LIAYYKLSWLMENAISGKKEPYELTTHSARVADMLEAILSKDERCQNVVKTGVADTDWPL